MMTHSIILTSPTFEFRKVFFDVSFLRRISEFLYGHISSFSSMEVIPCLLSEIVPAPKRWFVYEFVSGPCFMFRCCGDRGDYCEYLFICIYSSWIDGMEGGPFFVEVGLFSNFSVCPVCGSVVFSFSDYSGKTIYYVYLSEVIIHSL
jgi:hypothetical protein